MACQAGGPVTHPSCRCGDLGPEREATCHLAHTTQSQVSSWGPWGPGGRSNQALSWGKWCLWFSEKKPVCCPLRAQGHQPLEENHPWKNYPENVAKPLHATQNETEKHLDIHRWGYAPQHPPLPRLWPVPSSLSQMWPWLRPLSSVLVGDEQRQDNGIPVLGGSIWSIGSVGDNGTHPRGGVLQGFL